MISAWWLVLLPVFFVFGFAAGLKMYDTLVMLAFKGIWR
jgi:hypothetical protein